MATLVMKADGSAPADAYAVADLGGSRNEVSITFGMAIETASLATFAPWFASLHNNLTIPPDLSTMIDGASINTGPPTWSTFNAEGGDPTGLGDTWLNCEFYHVNGGASQFYISGVLIVDGVDGGTGAAVAAAIGQAIGGSETPPSVAYFRNVVMRDSRGGTVIFSDDFSSGNFSAWASTSGDVSIVDDPFPPSPPDPSPGQSIPLASIAFFSQAFDPTPSYNGPLAGLKSVQIDRGRNYLLSKTQTGTMVLTFHDTTGRYDPTNRTSPYYPEIGPMRIAKLDLVNPVDRSHNRLFTGFTEIWDFSYPNTPSNVIMDATAHCVDGFDALNRAEMPPDSSNRTTIPPFVGAGAVAARMLYILSFFAGAPYSGNSFPTNTDALFSGNVNVFNAVYNPQTSLLTGIQDTADAEFPNVSNTFMDKFGNLAFRGRATRFTPENYWNGAAHPPTLAKPISFWNVGDANACLTWPTNPPGSPSSGAMAPINDLGWDLDQTTLVNACECYPGSIGTQTAAVTGQLRTNGLSILKYGPRVLSIPDLYTAGSPALTGNPFLNPPGLTAKQETLLYADYFVQNLAVPEEHISTLRFLTVAPGTTRGNAWWKIVCGVEIGDVIILYTTDPGGGGFQAEQFFVEGIHYDIELGGVLPQIVMTLDVSPRKWFSIFNGFTFFPTNGFMAQDGQVTHNSTSFQSASFTFAPGNVGDRVTILDLATPAVPGVNPQQFTVAAYVSAHHVTLSANFTGTTTSVAPWEVIGA